MIMCETNAIQKRTFHESSAVFGFSLGGGDAPLSTIKLISLLPGDSAGF